MTDQELEQQLRAWYRAQVHESERAPVALRSSLASVVEAGVPLGRRWPGWELLPMALRRMVPVTIGAGVVMLALIVGFAFLDLRPSTVGGPSMVPGSSAPGDSTVLPGSAAWRTTGSMATARWDHAAVTLGNGRVLLVGGLGAGDADALAVLASAELYDPDTGTWSATGAMSTPRHGHTLTLLVDGAVLAVGGRRSADPEREEVTSLDSAELYDPATGTWTATTSMTAGRLGHTATVLDDGTVLVAGGHGTSGNVASAEIYDPSQRAWSATADMTTARTNHAATLLGDGTVLVTGGTGTRARGSAEVYDPNTRTWIRVGDLSTKRFAPTATLLADGRVLITGSMVSHGEIYDPSTRSWAQTQDAPWACADSSAALLSDGNVLQMCSHDSQVFDPIANTWTPDAPFTQARYWHTFTALRDGRVLAAGGQAVSDQGGILASAELYGQPGGIE